MNRAHSISDAVCGRLEFFSCKFFVCLVLLCVGMTQLSSCTLGSHQNHKALSNSNDKMAGSKLSTDQPSTGRERLDHVSCTLPKTTAKGKPIQRTAASFRSRRAFVRKPHRYGFDPPVIRYVRGQRFTPADAREIQRLANERGGVYRKALEDLFEESQKIFDEKRNERYRGASSIANILKILNSVARETPINSVRST